MTCSDRAVEALLPEVHCQLAIFCGVFAVKTPQPSKRNGIAGVQREKAEAGEVAVSNILIPRNVSSMSDSCPLHSRGNGSLTQAWWARELLPRGCSLR
ncbi:Otoancorin [Manis javanica]|nr:Otoancorin [Manis javanica]